MSAMNREQRRRNEESRRAMLSRDRRRRGRGRGGKSAGATKATGPRPAGPPPLRGALTLAATLLVWLVVMALVSLVGGAGSVFVTLPVMVILAFGTTALAHWWARRTVLGLIGFILYALSELTRTGSLRTSGSEAAWWLYFFIPVVLFYLAAMGGISRASRRKDESSGGS